MKKSIKFLYLLVACGAATVSASYGLFMTSIPIDQEAISMMADGQMALSQDGKRVALIKPDGVIKIVARDPENPCQGIVLNSLNVIGRKWWSISQCEPLRILFDPSGENLIALGRGIAGKVGIVSIPCLKAGRLKVLAKCSYGVPFFVYFKTPNELVCLYKGDRTEIFNV